MYRVEVSYAKNIITTVEVRAESKAAAEGRVLQGIKLKMTELKGTKVTKQI